MNINPQGPPYIAKPCYPHKVPHVMPPSRIPENLPRFPKPDELPFPRIPKPDGFPFPRHPFQLKK